LIFDRQIEIEIIITGNLELILKQAGWLKSLARPTWAFSRADFSARKNADLGR